MSVLFIALPVALMLGTIAVLAFVRAVRSGQFEDLDTPAVRVIFDDGDVVPRTRRRESATPPTG